MQYIRHRTIHLHQLSSRSRLTVLNSRATRFQSNPLTPIQSPPIQLSQAASFTLHRIVNRCYRQHRMQSIESSNNQRTSIVSAAAASTSFDSTSSSSSSSSTASAKRTFSTFQSAGGIDFDCISAKKHHSLVSSHTLINIHPSTTRHIARLTSFSGQPINMSTAPISQQEPQLQLTQLESRIFRLVLEACKQYQLNTQVRVAGGWVRDKLLGLESDDIDFALDNMSGEEFANKLSEYLKSIGEKTSSIGVIKVNPDQSKHLATATMKILDVSIDINNFREEIYEAGSRIPQITLSTAKEDALRRDFTSNSLFYNLHTGKVEDYVGGLEDLRHGLLRTPRDPFKTFSDDPLRILRAARFAGRFGYSIHESITAAASSASIQADLASKVSRERMGIEIGKCLHLHRSSFKCFALLSQQWHLRRIIFEPPKTFEPAPPSEIGNMPLQPIEHREDEAESQQVTQLAIKAMEIAHQIIHDTNETNKFSDEGASAIMLAAFLVPYYGYRTEVKKGRFGTLPWYIVRESLRLPQHDAQLSSDLLIWSHQLIRLSFLHRSTQSTHAADSQSQPRLNHLQIVTGNVLRQSGQYSIIAFRLAQIIIQLLPNETLQPGSVSVFDQLLGLKEAEQTISGDGLKQQFDQFIDWIEKDSRLLLLPVWEMKPIATGTDVCQSLGISPKGPHVGAIINKMLEWQMLNLDQMWALQQAQTASSSSSSSSTPSVSLESVKSSCFAWLQSNLPPNQPPAKR